MEKTLLSPSVESAYYSAGKKHVAGSSSVVRRESTRQEIRKCEKLLVIKNARHVRMYRSREVGEEPNNTSI